MIGTPFEIKNDEIHNRRVKKKDWKEFNEFALDEKGRRMFHGAFQGGNVKEANDLIMDEGFTPA